MADARGNLWGGGAAYESYMGRWSRRIAALFLEWLAPPAQARWLDIGCGTGVLASSILARCAPRHVLGIDPAPAFVEFARAQITDPRFACELGSAEALPCADAEFGAAVSGLVLNFVADKPQTGAQMKRVVAPGGVVGAYVWDYAGQMQIMRHFFDAATELDPGARRFDDGFQAPLCRPGPLRQLFEAAGFGQVEVRALDITAAFDSFDDYWRPFLGGTGSAPKYCASLAADARERLRDKLRARLPTGPDGEILLALRAWAAKGIVAPQN